MSPFKQKILNNSRGSGSSTEQKHGCSRQEVPPLTFLEVWGVWFLFLGVAIIGMTIEFFYQRRKRK
jgi:hypothetical protein